jgi:hypothetical protein
MEPELALVMNNLARVGLQKGAKEKGNDLSLVLDPFCGGAGLLIPAAYLGKVGLGSTKVVTVGCDAFSFEDNPCLLSSVLADCKQLGIPAPMLTTANIFDWEARDPSSPSTTLSAPPRVDTGCKRFSAIVTDPPYGIKAVIVIRDTEAKSNLQGGVAQRQEKTLHLFRALLNLSAAKLEPGGRLVCFIPSNLPPERSRAWSAKETAAVRSKELLSVLSPPQSLRLLHAVPQTFRGGTFKRYLVVFENAGLDGSN